MSTPNKPTEAELVLKLHTQLLGVIATLDEAMQHGIIIDFSVNCDAANKKASLTALQARKSYL